MNAETCKERPFLNCEELGSDGAVILGQPSGAAERLGVKPMKLTPGHFSFA